MADVFRFPSTPPPVPPKNIHRATFFTVIGPTNRPLTCAAYEIETGHRKAEPAITCHLPADRPAFPRPASRSRVAPARGRMAAPRGSADARTRQHQADEHLPERHPSRVAPRSMRASDQAQARTASLFQLDSRSPEFLAILLQAFLRVRTLERAQCA